MTGMYASMARTLNHFDPLDGRYNRADIHPLRVTREEKVEISVKTTPTVLSAAAIWSAFEAMSELNRPEEEADWQAFSSMRRVAWKTGTSWGSRDGWSIGVTPRWVVGVWVGNASGEGRAGLTGVGVAAPVMFDIFSILPADPDFFTPPRDELTEVAVCRQSGHRASDICQPVDTLLVPRTGIETPVCPYHRLVHLSPDGRWQVNSGCEPARNIVSRSWFVLPPAQEWWFRNHNPAYEVLPPARPDCREVVESIDIVYPEHGAEVFVPRGLDGRRESMILSAAHSDRDAALFWWLDGEYVGQTVDTHTIALQPTPGEHTLTITDGAGNRRSVLFTVRQ
jgi:penicillin-binding protein 1C